MPSFNASSYISEAIESVRMQSFTDWELIVIDDLSTDNSVELIRQFCLSDARVRLIEMPHNSGAAVARNCGIENAKGRFIAFLDSDDCWSPEKLYTQINFMQKNQVDFSFSGYEKVDAEGHSLGFIHAPPQIDYYGLLKCSRIGCLTAMYDTRTLGKVYMPVIQMRQDLGLWLKLLKKTQYAYGIDKSLAFYRVRDNSISANKMKAARYTWHLYRRFEHLGLLKSSYFFAHYAFNGFLRTRLPWLAKKMGRI